MKSAPLLKQEETISPQQFPGYVISLHHSQSCQKADIETAPAQFYECIYRKCDKGMKCC